MSPVRIRKSQQGRLVLSSFWLGPSTGRHHIEIGHPAECGSGVQPANCAGSPYKHSRRCLQRCVALRGLACVQSQHDVCDARLDIQFSTCRCSAGSSCSRYLADFNWRPRLQIPSMLDRRCIFSKSLWTCDCSPKEYQC